MSPTRRALMWALVVALFITVALMVSSDPGEVLDAPLVTTATAPDAVPVIADIRSTSDG